MYTFENSQYGTHWGNGAYQFHSIYLSISLSLNIVLTLMIVARLILRNRTVQNAVESLPPPDGLIGFVSTILTESCALYSIASVLYITLWIIDSYIVNYIIPIFEASQVRAYRRLTVVLGCHCLISVVVRSLVRSSSFCALPIEPR